MSVKKKRQFYVKKLLEHGKIHAARSIRIVGGFLVKGKWWFLFGFIILLVAGAFFIPNMIMYNHLKQDVVEHVIESEGVNKSEIVATYVYKKGFPHVGVYYTFDQGHIYLYSRNQETNEILFMKKKEVDRVADYWVVPFLD